MLAFQLHNRLSFCKQYQTGQRVAQMSHSITEAGELYQSSASFLMTP